MCVIGRDGAVIFDAIIHVGQGRCLGLTHPASRDTVFGLLNVVVGDNVLYESSSS